MAKPKEALEEIEALTELRNTVDPSDFTLMKYNLKLMIGYFPERENFMTNSFEQVEMKKIIDAATTLNNDIIAKHGYKKFTSHLDYSKLTTIEGFFDIDDYTRL